MKVKFFFKLQDNTKGYSWACFSSAKTPLFRSSLIYSSKGNAKTNIQRLTRYLKEGSFDIKDCTKKGNNDIQR